MATSTIVQKSLYEGFGLTATEAMWKEKPVVASAVGGIADQITNGENGILIQDPTSLTEFGAAVRQLLEEPELRNRLAAAAPETVRQRYITTRHLTQYADLVVQLLKSS